MHWTNDQPTVRHNMTARSTRAVNAWDSWRDAALRLPILAVGIRLLGLGCKIHATRISDSAGSFRSRGKWP